MVSCRGLIALRATKRQEDVPFQSGSRHVSLGQGGDSGAGLSSFRDRLLESALPPFLKSSVSHWAGRAGLYEPARPVCCLPCLALPFLPLSQR